MDLSFLDQPDILETVFPVVYSPLFSFNCLDPSFMTVPTYPVEVEAGIKINCANWVAGKEHPSILFFHGNGEMAVDYDWIAPFYNRRGINLFVADYRGYGSSDGKPTISNMLGDAQAIYLSFKEMMRQEGFNRSLFVMGRSLGSMPAIELAFSYQDEIKGLIIESGSANNFRRLWHFLRAEERELISGESLFLNKVKVRQVYKPTLIIHGQFDQAVSDEEIEELYRNSGAQDKKTLVIPGADHNDIMICDPDLYFGTIEKFVKDNS